jgi:hypothetical protein
MDHLPRGTVHKTRWLRKYDSCGTQLLEIELDENERPRHAPHRASRRESNSVTRRGWRVRFQTIINALTRWLGGSTIRAL